jgi:two-component system, NtrC family, response regulator GlrR
VTFAAEPAVPRSRPRLTWTDQAGSHAIDLREAQTAGSAPRCELVVSDRAVSRLHVELAPREDGLWVRDLGSRNGTYVAGVKIEVARVPGGAAIRLGTTDVTVTYEAPQPPDRIWPVTDFHGLVGRSAAIREVFARVAELAKDDAPVVLVGEPGTGKEALARVLHDASARAGKPFVVVDCAALPEPRLAAERLEEALGLAEGGTLLLDEPQELSLALQRELAPPLDARAFRAVATTTKDLRLLLNQGAFREDLYFRLAGATLLVPPLRQRLVDLDILLATFLGDQAAIVTPELVHELARFPWTGNVRELVLYAEKLRSAGLERSGGMPVLAEQREPLPILDGIEARTVEAPVVDLGEGAPSSAFPPVSSAALLPPGLERWFETGFKDFRERWIEVGEREYLRRLLLRTNRSSSLASREAGVERTYLYRLIKKHGV